MASTKQQIITDIENHIAQCGGGYAGWYTGVASDPRDRLFNDHRVKEKGDAWIYREAESSTAAREVEDYFVRLKGTQGGSGGGDHTSRYVYAYKVAPHTRE